MGLNVTNWIPCPNHVQDGSSSGNPELFWHKGSSWASVSLTESEWDSYVDAANAGQSQWDAVAPNLGTIYTSKTTSEKLSCRWSMAGCPKFNP